MQLEQHYIDLILITYLLLVQRFRAIYIRVTPVFGKLW